MNSPHVQEYFGIRRYAPPPIGDGDYLAQVGKFYAVRYDRYGVPDPMTPNS
jgi:hypothetical protein